MLSRRETLAVAAMTPMAGLGAGSAYGQAPSALKTPLNFEVPAGACDSHVHVFPDPAKFPFSPNRVYSPPINTAADLLALQHALHMDRVVIVTPSVYGADNAATLDGMRELGPQRARGVAVIDAKMPRAELEAMMKQGVRGVRINLETSGVFDPETSARAVDDTVKQIAGLPWHIQMYARLSVFAALHDKLATVPVPVVFDHFAGADAALGPSPPGWDAVLDLVKSGRAYVKISGAYRASTRAPDYPDVVPLARSLIAANPDRLVWGSDWPHPDSAKVPGRAATDIAPAQAIDDGRVLNLLAEWAPDAAVRQKILVDNPARLYDF